MEAADVEAIVRDWVDRAGVDERTGAPPDAKVRVAARRITTLGHLSPGQSRPDSGMELWAITTSLHFPAAPADDGPAKDPFDDPEIVDVLQRLEASIGSQQVLAGGELEVEWLGAEPAGPRPEFAAPPDYPTVEVRLSAKAWT